MIAKLSQPEYLHILLNHLPIVGLAVATVATLAALLLRNRGAILIGLALTALLSAAAWPVMESGENAYSRVRPLADEDGKDALREHMYRAEDWFKLYYTTAVAAVLAMVVGWKKPKWLPVAAMIAALLAAASLVAGAYIAEAGGWVRHPEFRSDEPPVQEAAEPDSR